MKHSIAGCFSLNGPGGEFCTLGICFYRRAPRRDKLIREVNVFILSDLHCRRSKSGLHRL